MDSLQQLTATPTTIELRGGAYRLTPLTVGDYGAMERTITGLRGNTVRATPSEIHEWLNSRDGTAYALWLALLHYNKDVSWAWCRDVVDSASPDELEHLRGKLDDGCDLSLKETIEPGQPPEHNQRRERPIPWRRIFRSLSLTHGWTPREIADLTLAQICLYLDDTPQPGETVRLPATEARALARRKRAAREAHRDDHLCATACTQAVNVELDEGTARLQAVADLNRTSSHNMPFDALMTLAERLRTSGEQLPDGAGRRDGLTSEQEDAAAADRDVDAHAGRWLPRRHDPLSFAPSGSDAHASHQRHTEILLRVDENLRRLCELVESRATVSRALLADPL